MSARPRLLLFDLDGVLADYDRLARCRTLAQLVRADASRVHEVLFGKNGLEHASDRGELGLAALLRKLREHHGWSLGPEAFLDARRSATRVRADVLDLCSELSGQVRLGVFTNNGDWLVEQIDRIAPELRGVFGDAMVSSGQLRHWKPEQAAFHACLGRLGDAAPSTTLFVDDSAVNVAGAQSAGLDALLYTDTATLRAQLRERGFELRGDENAS